MASKTTETLNAAAAALAAQDWLEARALFEKEIHASPTGEAFEGLSRALWWSGEPRAAIDSRRSAYAAYRRNRNAEAAAQAACWLAGEYQTLLGQEGISEGWLQRASRLLATQPNGKTHGWLALVQARLSSAPGAREARAREALECAREFDDRDLELQAISQLGLALVQAGRVDDGVALFHESLAAATSGEAEFVETVAEVYCDALRASELIGEAEPFAEWAGVILEFTEKRHMPFVAFCAACCGELLIDEGNWEEAEAQLLAGIDTLNATGHRPRCVHPVATLATLRIHQGRLEDAAELLTPYGRSPEALLPRARLALARGRPSAAARLLAPALESLGSDTLESVPVQSLLIEAYLECGELEQAAAIATGLAELASRAGTKRLIAIAALGQARAASARGGRDAAADLAKATTLLDDAGMRFEGARARMEYARAVSPEDRALALEQANEALAVFADLGATRDGDAAHHFLRTIGAPARTGKKGAGYLSEREREVLALLAAGLTNQEIAERLFISVKTAGHHVSRILSKLGLRTRTEAAAFATLAQEQGTPEN